MSPSVCGEIIPRVMGAGASVGIWTLGIVVRSASDGYVVAGVGKVVVGEMVPRREEEDKVGIGVGGGDGVTAVGGAVGGEGVSGNGGSVCSGLGDNVGDFGTEGGGKVRSAGVGGAVTVGMAAVGGTAAKNVEGRFGQG